MSKETSMNPYAKDSRRYQQNQIMSANPVQLVVLLYEGALSQVSSAIHAIHNRNIEARTNHINRACAMIAELQSGLDMQKGGEIAVSLNRLYGYITRRLCEANWQNSVARLEEIQKLLSPLWSAWQQVAEQNQPAMATEHARTLSMAVNG
jgi:flagellar secretion chaperone FliS